ncbi:MAG: hypothetical protein AB1730_23605 [Myxococcota bacterium]|jgi:hypothetical protein
MLRRLLAAVALVALAACGGGNGNGLAPNAVYFWQVTSSTVEFGQCSDEAQFRMNTQPLPFTDNSYVIYRVSGDGKRATTQDCARLDATTCKDAANPIVFSIAGRELTFSRESKEPVGMTGCNLQQAETWTLTDAQKTMSLEIANVLSLVDSPPACESVENELKARSPNMLGIQGCVVTFKLTGDLK